MPWTPPRQRFLEPLVWWCRRRYAQPLQAARALRPGPASIKLLDSFNAAVFSFVGTMVWILPDRVCSVSARRKPTGTCPVLVLAPRAGERRRGEAPAAASMNTYPAHPCRDFKRSHALCARSCILSPMSCRGFRHPLCKPKFQNKARTLPSFPFLTSTTPPCIAMKAHTAPRRLR